MRAKVAWAVIAAGAGCWALLAIDTHREVPPAASAGVAEAPPAPAELVDAPVPAAPAAREPPRPPAAQPAPAAQETTNHSELPPAAPDEPEPAAEPQLAGDFTRDAPTVLERTGELSSSFERWQAAPEDPRATAMVTRHLEREINARYLTPKALYVDCREAICRIKVTFDRPEELVRLRGIGGSPSGLRFDFRGPEIHPGGATLVLYGLKGAAEE